MAGKVSVVLITFLDNEEDEREPSLAEVVAKIKAHEPEPELYTPPTESLAQLLADAIHEVPINTASWNREWAAVEAAMKQRDLADDQREARV